jgi:tRNA G18 (ribose-2'-O)-methylase SpoU
MSVHVKKIYSENNDYQHLEVLKRNREKRHKYREFFVEGVKSIERALHNQWEIRSLVYSSQTELSNWAKDILSHSKAPVHYDLQPELMAKLSDKEECSEIIAIVAMPPNDPARIKVNRDFLVVVFDRPSSYGNLGTIIRSCDSFRVNGLIITGHCVDLYDPQTIRSSMGSLFSVPVLKLEPAELFAWLDHVTMAYPNLQTVGTSAKAERNISGEDFTKPTVLFLGNETDGLSRNYKNYCHTSITIPIQGSATSLNVACAASICLYEIDRQRRKADEG